MIHNAIIKLGERESRVVRRGWLEYSFDSSSTLSYERPDGKRICGLHTDLAALKNHYWHYSINLVVVLNKTIIISVFFGKEHFCFQGDSSSSCCCSQPLRSSSVLESKSLKISLEFQTCVPISLGSDSQKKTKWLSLAHCCCVRMWKIWWNEIWES